MKAKFVSKILCLFFCPMFCVSAISAQIKVGEYKGTPVNLDALAEMADVFAEQLAAEPSTTRGFINLYDNSAEAKRIKSVLAKKPELKDRILFFPPGLRFRQTASSDSGIEFWLIPEGAESPYQPVCGLCVCPTLRVSGLRPFYNQTEYLTFTANVSGGSEEDIKYAWKISAGEIVSGQGTPTIKVDLTGVTEITATVEISGVCDECLREASLTIKIQQ